MKSLIYSGSIVGDKHFHNLKATPRDFVIFFLIYRNKGFDEKYHPIAPLNRSLDIDILYKISC